MIGHFVLTWNGDSSQNGQQAGGGGLVFFVGFAAVEAGSGVSFSVIGAGASFPIMAVVELSESVDNDGIFSVALGANLDAGVPFVIAAEGAGSGGTPLAMNFSMTFLL